MPSFFNRLLGRRPAVSPDSVYSGLRTQALRMSAEELGVPEDKGEAVLGLVTDWGMDTGVCTVVCFVSGDASMYMQTGGGVIGGGAHDSVREAARLVVNTAAEYAGYFSPATTHPLPSAGSMRFAVLTTKGTYATTAPVHELASQKHPLAPLGNAIQMLIAKLRENAPSEE